MAVANARIDLVNNGLVAEGVTPGGIQTVKTYTTDRRNYILGQLRDRRGAIHSRRAGESEHGEQHAYAERNGARKHRDHRGERAGDFARVVIRHRVERHLSARARPEYSSSARWMARGNVLGSTTLTVTYTGAASWPALRINEWMASNNRISIRG